MFVGFIDESDHKHAYFVYTLLIPDFEIIKLQNSLNFIASGLPVNYGIFEDSEFHGYDILNGMNDWASLKTNHKDQMEIFEKLIDTILLHDVKFFVKGVTRAKFVPNYGSENSAIHHAALTWNVEKVQKYISQLPGIALLIADETSEQDYHQKKFSQYRKNGTFGWDSVNLVNIVDTIHFSPSKSSRLLQAVDILAYAHKIGTTKHRNALAQNFYDRMWAKVSSSGRVQHLSSW